MKTVMRGVKADMLKERKVLKRPGMSLVEMLVTLMILVIMSAVLFWVLMMVKTGYQASSARAGGRQDLALALAGISGEMMDSNVDTVTNNTSLIPPALSFLAAYNSQGGFVTDPSNGKPVWQKYVIYYIPSGTSSLLRMEIYGTFTGPLSTAQLQAYCNGQGRRVISSASSLGLALDTGNRTASISLTVRDTSVHGKADQQTQSLTVFFNN